MTIYQSTQQASFDFYKRLSLGNDGELVETPLELLNKEGCLTRAVKSGAVRVENQPLLKHNFTQKISRYIEQKARAGSFSELVLVSEIRNMKQVKRAFSPQVKKLVKSEIELVDREVN